jgi:hypothetical protein
VQENVVALQVTMNDVLRMQVTEIKQETILKNAAGHNTMRIKLRT